MTFPWQIIAQAPYAFAWREGTGPVRAGWGNEPCSGDSTGIELRFRHFHDHATPRADSWWRNFPRHGCLRFPLHEATHLPPRTPLSLGTGEPATSKDSWHTYCEKIETVLAGASVKKIVPARAKQFSPLSEQDRVSLLPTLMDRPAPGSFRFFLRYQDACFFGATPELLFRKQGDLLHVPAIAGTRPLATGGLETAASQLRADAKELAEHRFVVEGILASLRALGLRPTASAEPSILVARNLAHLHTPISCPHEGVSGESLVAALHPTPAVGGFPRQASADFITAEEPWDRGLFASPLHIVSAEEELCLVAIRSALSTPERLFFFAGAGYVPGSNWEREWIETDHKMESLKGLLEES